MEYKLETGDKVHLSCTWGDGPDVCVNIYRNPFEINNWPKGFIPIDLTGDEAIAIGCTLIQIGEQAKKIDCSYYYCMKNKEKGEK